MPDGMTTRTVFCTGNPVVSWQNVPAACEREYITLITVKIFLVTHLNNFHHFNLFLTKHEFLF